MRANTICGIAQLSRDGIAINVLETMTPVDQWAKYTIEAPQDGQYVIEAFYSTGEKTPLLVEMNGAAVATDALSQTTGGWDLKFERWEQVARCDLRSGLNFLRLTAKKGSFPHLDRLRVRRARPEDDTQLQSIAAARGLDPMLVQQFMLDPQDPWPTTSGMVRYLDASQAQTVAELDAKIQQLEASRRPCDLVISVADQPAPADMPVHVRGDTYAMLPKAVPRGAPHLLDGAFLRRRFHQTTAGVWSWLSG